MASGWSRSDLPDQSGRTAIVTGANSGIGYETATALAGAGADVVLACRSVERGKRAAARIGAEHPRTSATVLELDLADLSSIASFADRFRARFDDLHVLVNNAGVMAIPREETADGFERQFGVNHLGHFALTGHLLERLRETDGESRVVTVSSGMHQQGSIDFDDLHGEASYDRWDAYAQSKLANLLFAFELDRRLAAADADVISVGAHPGYADTGLQFRGPKRSGSRLELVATRILNALLAQSPERGALPILYAATVPGVEGGAYYGPGGFLGMRGPPERVEPSDRARDEELAARLWEVSAAETGVTYDLARPSRSAD